MSAHHYLKSLSNCYKNPSIRINTLSGISNSEPNNVPIRVAPKFRNSKSKKRTNNYVSPLFDSRGHPDEETDWESMLPEVKAGKLIRKRKHTAPPIDNIDPNFGVPYNEAKHGDILRSELDISHLTPSQQITLTDCIKKFWRVFSKEGVTTPVKDYECEIDTGNARPVACKNATFGPREQPIIEKAIAKLLELGHIKQIYEGEWLSKPLLAAKPHQENVTNIEDFVWRFCVSYIRLNSVTKIITMPIPRCDSAVGTSFGNSRFRWLMDAVSGYNQLRVAFSSQVKLAFAGPNCSKYTWLVMPFGPVNGPVIFIIFIHDLDSTWKALATKRGLTIDETLNTKIIVDDIFSWAKTFEEFMAMLTCQLEVCQSQNLSLSLKKSFFCPQRMEFVGHDVCENGNCPALSKHALMKSWPAFVTARDVASFIGFLIFYSIYIPYFEQRIVRLRELSKQEMETNITDQLTPAHLAERDDMINAICSDPCVARFDYNARPYLLTDFSSKGFGYDLCQPDSNHAPSVAAMHREMAGSECEFLLPKTTLRLRTTGFGSRATKGREKFLHSHLGEAFALDWAIHKNRAKLWGVRFTALTDCYALRFILSYDGTNPVLLRQQMRFQLWAMDLYHRSGFLMVSPDYFSRTGANLCFDELTRLYLDRTINLRKNYPPVTGTMQPQNMPGYRAPRIRSALAAEPAIAGALGDTTVTASYVDPSIAPILTSIYCDDSGGHSQCLQVVPILTGYLSSNDSDQLTRRPLYQQDISLLATEIITYTCAVYGFNSGHFLPLHHQTPMDVALAADTHPSGRALFKKFTRCPSISNSADDLLKRIQTSAATGTIHAYIIHSHRFRKKETEHAFWTIQSAIIRTLRAKRGTQIFWVFIHPSCDMGLAKLFRRSTSRTGWIISSTTIYFPDFGDSIADNTTVYVGIHKGCTSNHTAINVAFPPQIAPQPLASFLYEPFNVKPHAVSLSRYHADFTDGGCVASDPPPSNTPTQAHRAKKNYLLHRPGDNTNISCGAGVYDTAGICPPFCSPNTNIFGSLFGVEYDDGPDTFIRPIASYEVAKTFRLHDDVTYALAHPANFLLLDCGIPTRTSNAFLDAISSRLDSIRTENFEIHDPKLSHAPAAITMAPAFVNGAIGSRIPNPSVWKKALNDDPETKILSDMVADPGLTSDKEVLGKLHFVYREPARRGNFTIRDGILYMKEIFAHNDKFVELRIVPESLRNIIFIAFHANPIGAHLDAPRTFHRIRQRYFWPGMYTYCKRLIKSCPACALANATQSRSSDLVYGFPIDAPMRVLFVDVYAAGTEVNFDGTKNYLIAACGMTSFAICEDTAETTAEAFAKAIMKIWLRFGFSHTIVVDKASTFRGVFAETAALLGINIHVLSGENHDPMIVERVNRFLNSSLTIFCNERGTNKVALEGILMALYAWNSAPVIGTDISRSLLVVGREFQFPIDFSADQHHILTSNPDKAHAFATSQAHLLKYCRVIAQELIHHHRAWHREYINARRPSPRIYDIGDTVFAKRAVRSDKKRGLVGKLMNSFTGPWEIIRKLAGSSYEMKHRNTGKTGKRHAAHISPFPRELLPFMPISGADNQYGQINAPIQADPYKHAGIKGFKPTQPFNFASVTVSVTTADDAIHFPTLDELNKDLFDWHNGEEAALYANESLCIELDVFASMPTTIRPPPSPTPTPATPIVPDIIDLTANLFASTDKLFFIAHKIPGSDITEWHLVQVDLPLSLQEHPSAFQDGKFLVNFFTCHPSDKFFNASNQRYWLEYHPKMEEPNPGRHRSTHLIRPTIQSPNYAVAEGLLPFRQWVRLTNADTYITGPFDWALVNNRKSRDRVSTANWKILGEYTALFSNAVPDISLPSYSIHYSQPHSSYESREHNERILAFITAPSSPNSV